LTKIQIKSQKSNALSWAVFLVTIEIVLISLTSVVFPALLTRSVSRIADIQIDSWEFGVWALPLIITNLIILVIGIFYIKNKLPNLISNSIKHLFDFEVSKKVSFLVLVILLSIYITSSVSELSEEELWEDFPAVKKTAENWSFDSIFKEFNLHFRFFLLSSSIEIFDNIRMIPFFASISLLILTYFITVEISQKRFAGLIATTILLQSHVFLEYDTTATYENFWTLLYMLSLYLIYKSWPLSPVSYVLSLVSKPLTALFLPCTFFFIYRSNIPKKKKIQICISYLIVIILGVVAIQILDINLVGNIPDPITDLYFWQGFTSMAYQLRFDVVLLLFLLPLTIGLFLTSRQGFKQADSVMILIAGILLSAPLLTGMTELTNQPYRFVPLIVFFALGVGTILSKRDTKTIQ